MKITFIGDMHLSDVENTPQEEGLDWAIDEINKLSPDACAVVGDITACGSLDAALRFRKKISKLRCPILTVPGNSDLRDSKTEATLSKILLTHPRALHLDKLSIVGIDSSRNKISEAERERLVSLTLRENVILCSHQPKYHIDPDSREFLKNWTNSLRDAGHKILLWASGHTHLYAKDTFNEFPMVTLRAIDLDKCSKGSAQILVLDFDGENSTLESIDYQRGLHTSWSEAERAEFVDFLGITCYNNTKIERDMPFAIENGVRHLEWRSISEKEFDIIEKWRQSGGKTFSLHFQDMNFDNSVIGIESFNHFAKNAIRASADAVTVHPPQIANEKLLRSPHIFDAVADAMAETLLPVAEAGIKILVENNHTSHGTPPDPLKCDFGCTPFDVIAWRDALRERLGNDTCQLRFDVGHARNNMPLSQDYPIGKWYALIGSEAQGYHLHQTIDESSKMKNHYPITGIHDGFVSFDGFLWAWKTGLLNHAPLILEIREGEGAPATYTRLKNIIMQKTGEG